MLDGGNPVLQRTLGAQPLMKNLFTRFIRDDEGQDIIEYRLLAAFISVVAYLTLQAIGQDVETMVLRRQVGEWRRSRGRSLVEPQSSVAALAMTHPLCDTWRAV